MKIITTLPNDLYEGSMELDLITNEGEKYLSFGGGEPEDNCLARDLNGAMFIDELLRMAYNAGKNGEELEVIRKKEEEDE